MAGLGRHRHTVYDVMEAKGVFEQNPANTSAGQKYVKQQFPQMFYHPEGMERVTAPGEYIMTPIGPKLVGEQREIIWKVAENLAEATALRQAGWHDHPAKAMRAAGKEAPLTSSAEHIASLEQQIKMLEEQLKAGKEEQEAMAAREPLEGRPPTNGLLA